MRSPVVRSDLKAVGCALCSLVGMNSCSWDFVEDMVMKLAIVD